MPASTRSLFNRPLIVYSGQNDAQMQAALVMQVPCSCNPCCGESLLQLVG